MLFLFVISALMVVWAYAGYPLSMYFFARRSRTFDETSLDTSEYRPTVSIIITAADEHDKILTKLNNTISLRYPPDLVEIIVTLDGSTDEMDNKVREFQKQHPDVRIVLMLNDKGGKESAQLAAVNIALNEICVFTDVATHLEPDALLYLTRHFYDEQIGAVDGMSRVETHGHSNEGIYLKYENKIREWESKVSGIVTMGGCLFAARTSMLQAKEPVEGFVSNLQSDFRTALVTATNGLRAVIDTDAVATFADGAENKEFGRKHRTVVRGINNLFHHLYLLNPLKYGMFSYALFNHKLMKWLVPFFLIGAFVANTVLAMDSLFFMGVWFLHSAFYGMAILSLPNKWVKIIQFFVVTNLAILKAWVSYARGERFVMWNTTKR